MQTRATSFEYELQDVLNRVYSNLVLFRKNPLHTNHDFDITTKRFMNTLSDAENVMNAHDDRKTFEQFQDSFSFFHNDVDEGALIRLRDIVEQFRLILPEWILDYVARLETIPSLHAKAWEDPSFLHSALNVKKTSQPLSPAQRIEYTALFPVFLLRSTKHSSYRVYTQDLLLQLRDSWKERFEPLIRKYESLIDFLPHSIILLTEYHKNDTTPHI